MHKHQATPHSRGKNEKDRRMTDRNPPSQHKVINRESHLNIFERLAQTLKIFFKTETPPRKKRIEEVNPTKQEFYLPKSLSSQLFIIIGHRYY